MYSTRFYVHVKHADYLNIHCRGHYMHYATVATALSEYRLLTTADVDYCHIQHTMHIISRTRITLRLKL